MTARVLAVALGLALMQGCVIADHHRGHKGGWDHDDKPHDGWGDDDRPDDGWGGGDGHADDCEALEEQLEANEGELAEWASSVDSDLHASQAELEAAWAEGEANYTAALLSADAVLSATLAEIAVNREATLGRLLEAYKIALSEERYEDAAMVFAAYLAAEEELASIEAAAWTAYEAAVVSATERWENLQQELSAAAADLDAWAAQAADELAAGEQALSELALEVEECWEAVDGDPRQGDDGWEDEGEGRA